MELHIKTNSQNSMPAPTKQVELPCVPILLNILSDEYDHEKTRAERIDNKAVGLLTILVALVTVYVPIFPFDDLVCFYKRNQACWIFSILLSICLVLGIFAIILAVYSANKMINVYKTKDYRAVNVEYFNSNEKLGSVTSDGFQVELIDHYRQIILDNSEINKSKTDILGNQFRNVMIVFVLLSISAIGTKILIGL